MTSTNSIAIPSIYSMDIETDTSVGPYQYPNGIDSECPPGLDARVSGIISMASCSCASNGSLKTQAIDVYGSPDGEGEILDEIGRVLRRNAKQGMVLVTWNGTGFDLPFITVRARLSNPDYRLRMEPFRPAIDLEPKYGWPEWANGVTDSGTWGSSVSMVDGLWDTLPIPHLDIAPHFQRTAEDLGVRWSLKPVAQAVLGIEPLDVEGANVSSLSSSDRILYVSRDAVITIQLAQALIASNPEILSGVA